MRQQLLAALLELMRVESFPRVIAGSEQFQSLVLQGLVPQPLLQQLELCPVLHHSATGQSLGQRSLCRKLQGRQSQCRGIPA